MSLNKQVNSAGESEGAKAALPSIEIGTGGQVAIEAARRELQAYTTRRWGLMGRFFRTGVPYWPARPEAADSGEVVMGEQDEEEVEFAECKSNASCGSMNTGTTEDHVERRRKVQHYADEYQACRLASHKLFGIISDMLTPRSKEVVEKQKEYGDLFDAMDPYGLWRLIVRLHTQGEANVKEEDGARVWTNCSGR